MVQFPSLQDMQVRTKGGTETGYGDNFAPPSAMDNVTNTMYPPLVSQVGNDHMMMSPIQIHAFPQITVTVSVENLND
jgi:hypothetical protein